MPTLEDIIKKYFKKDQTPTVSDIKHAKKLAKMIKDRDPMMRIKGKDLKDLLTLEDMREGK